MRKLIGAVIFLTCAATLAACGGGSVTAPTVTVTPTPIAPQTTPTPTAPTPAPLSTSVPLSASALNAQPVATTIPAPTGYTSNINVPTVSAPANTSIQIGSSVGAPTQLPALQSNRFRRTPAGIRPLSGSGQFNGIFYETVVPSQNVVVAGNVSFTQSFPSGGLTTGTNYYLAFYDATQPSPSWTTIAGPVMPAGSSLTFSGTVGSFTFMSGKLYGFAIFSLSSPTATPPPATSQTVAYVPEPDSNQVQAITATGTVTQTLNIPTYDVGLDDAGNVYSLARPTTAPSTAPSASPGPVTLTQYLAGSSTPNATYTLSNPQTTYFVVASGAGEVLAAESGSTSMVYDVWDPGKSGAPSRTFSPNQGNYTSFAIAHDGTIYLPSNQNGVLTYLIYAPGTSTVERTITESIVPQAQQANFSPSYIAVGPDGTLYVTEYTYSQPDSLAGLYIYPPNGPEKFVATTTDTQGLGPQGVDIDATGNIYVANNNGYYDSSSTWHVDDLHDIEVFAPGGSSVLRHITGNFDPYPLAVAADGTLFFASFNPTVRGAATFGVTAGSSTATQIATAGGNTIAIYNGYQETLSWRHHTASYSGTAAAAQAGGASFKKWVQRMHHHTL